MFYQTIQAFSVSVTEDERRVHQSDSDTTKPPQSAVTTNAYSLTHNSI